MKTTTNDARPKQKDRGATDDNSPWIVPVILCGGSGKRLWPVSRQSNPKQFQRLYSDHSLLQETILRADGVPDLANPLLICSGNHKFLISEQLGEINTSPLAVMCEPASRGTGPALCAAASMLYEQNSDAIMLVMPSDHRIGNAKAFGEAVRTGCEAASRGRLVLFGSVPTRPETGYGYIRSGQKMKNLDDAFAVSRFVEKPDQATAQSYVDEGHYLWNCGIFMFPVATLLEEFSKHSPDISQMSAAALDKGQIEDEHIHLDAGAFSRAPDISVDRAVLENTKRCAVVRVDMDWSDIGTWHSLRLSQPADADGNVANGRALLDHVSNSYIHANGRLVAAVGVDDLVVVDTDDALLISSAAEASRIDDIVQQLQNGGYPEGSEHKRVSRPWGTYESVDDGQRFQVKHITVKPGGKLSLQMHHHRAEHWIIVAGTAQVTCGEESRLLSENESIHIPVGTKHRLENPGKLPLHLIEVQVGAYLGEDDIVRYSDTYGRA